MANQQNPNQPGQRQQSQQPGHEGKGGHAGQHGEMPKRNPDAQPNDPRQAEKHGQGHGARKPDQGGKH